MQRINHKVSLDIYEIASQFSLSLKQGDTSRRLVVVLTANGQIYKITDDCRAVFASTKPDGTIVLNDCIIQDNTILYDITSQSTSSVGIADCEITLYGGDGAVLTSPRFKLKVYETVYSEEKIESTDEYHSIMTVIAEANKLFESIDAKIEDGTVIAWKGEKGDPGVGISKIEKTNTVGLQDVYTIYYTNGAETSFVVTNGKDGSGDGNSGDGGSGLTGADGRGITCIAKSGSNGLIDTYVIYYTDGETSTFSVTNGATGSPGEKGEQGEDGKSAYQIWLDLGNSGSEADFIAWLKGKDGADGIQGNKGDTGVGWVSASAGTSYDEGEYTVTPVTFTKTNNTTSTINVRAKNGSSGEGNGSSGEGNGSGEDCRSIDKIEKTSTDGLVDTYTIYYTDGTTSTFTVTNGSDSSIAIEGYTVANTGSLNDSNETLPTSKLVYEAIEKVDSKVNALPKYVYKIKVNDQIFESVEGLINLGELGGVVSSALPNDIITITPDDSDYWVLLRDRIYPDVLYWNIAFPLSDAVYRVFNENHEEVIVPTKIDTVNNRNRILYRIGDEKGTYRFHRVSSQETVNRIIKLENRVTEVANYRRFEHFVIIKTDFDYLSSPFSPALVSCRLYLQYSTNDNSLTTDISEFLNSFDNTLVCSANGRLRINELTSLTPKDCVICRASINSSGIEIQYFEIGGSFSNIVLQNPEIVQHIVR